MAYVPRAFSQVDRSDPCWRTSCWAAVGAWLTNAATRGRRRPDMEWFRDRAGVSHCATGGLDDIRAGLQAIRYKQRTAWEWGAGRVHRDLTGEELRDRLEKDTGRLFWLATEFDGWDDNASLCQPGYNNPADGDSYHSIGVVAGLGTGPNKNKVRILNPLCQTLKWVPVTTVVRAAVRYAKEHQGLIDALSVLPPDRNEFI